MSELPGFHEKLLDYLLLGARLPLAEMNGVII